MLRRSRGARSSRAVLRKERQLVHQRGKQPRVHRKRRTAIVAAVVHSPLPRARHGAARGRGGTAADQRAARGGAQLHRRGGERVVRSPAKAVQRSALSYTRVHAALWQRAGDARARYARALQRARRAWRGAQRRSRVATACATVCPKPRRRTIWHGVRCGTRPLRRVLGLAHVPLGSYHTYVLAKKTLFSSVRAEAQRHAVHAVAQAGGLGPVREHVAEVAAAARAAALARPKVAYAVQRLQRLLHRPRLRLEEAGPPGAAVELGGRRKQRRAAPHAAVSA